MKHRKRCGLMIWCLNIAVGVIEVLVEVAAVVALIASVIIVAVVANSYQIIVTKTISIVVGILIATRLISCHYVSVFCCCQLPSNTNLLHEMMLGSPRPSGRFSLFMPACWLVSPSACRWASCR